MSNSPHKPFYQDSHVTILNGHVLTELGGLLSESVQCVITSPPYWALRDYGLEPQVWDAVEGCEHEWGEEKKVKFNPQQDASGGVGGGRLHGTRGQQGWTAGTSGDSSQGQFCLHCNAWRGSLGLEPTLELYVKHITDIFRELKRMLKKDGVCFLNLGDSYAGSSMSGGDQTNRVGGGTSKLLLQYEENEKVKISLLSGLKLKDLCGIPWRVAFALQADGWYLRSDIIWSKPNPMPESVRDRPTKSHEYIFLLTKSAKYYWDQDAVREPSEDKANRVIPKGHKSSWKMGKQTGRIIERNGKSDGCPSSGRNIRSVWTIATEPTPEAHFATFPKELASRCIKAGSKIGDTILDPFGGSGKTAIVAKTLGRKAILIELSRDYCEMPLKKLAAGQFAWEVRQ